MTRATPGRWRWSRLILTIAAVALIAAARYWGWIGDPSASSGSPTARPTATARPAAAASKTATPTATGPTAPVTRTPTPAASRRTPTPTRAAAPRSTPTKARPSPTQRPQFDESGLPLVAAADLPPEARETLRLIERGGPFPYDRDGVTFQNRERLLPRQPAGYYREYTVETPGSRDRGARRIIAGEQGERYYTDDHYASFARVED